MAKSGIFTLKSFIVVTAWLGMLAFIAYVIYKDLSKATESFNTVLGAALSIANIAIAKWLFGEKV